MTKVTDSPKTQEQKAPPKGTDTWRFPKDRSGSIFFEVTIDPNKADENPLIFEKFTSLQLKDKFMDSVALVLKAVVIQSNVPIEEILGSGYAMRSIMPKVVGLMEAGEVEVKKN